MKKIYLMAILSLFLFGCTNNEPKVAEKPMEKKPATEQQKAPETVAAHTLDKEKDAASAKADKEAPAMKDLPKKSGEKTRWSRSGTPVDVSSETKGIEEAKKKVDANPKDESLKKNLSQAYARRGVTLTNSQQYAAAIGDFRKALQYDSSNEVANNWVKQITTIYKSLNKEAPKEGEEPEPLEFKGNKS